MTSPDVPLRIGAKCGGESDSLLLLDQVCITVTLYDYDGDNLHVPSSILKTVTSTTHSYVVIVTVFVNQL